MLQTLRLHTYCCLLMVLQARFWEINSFPLQSIQSIQSYGALQHGSKQIQTRYEALQTTFPTKSSFLNIPSKQTDVIHFTTRLYNIYDDWRSDASADITHLDEENVKMCLEEFIYSDYGSQMFGVHERAASFGITGQLKFVELSGPEVTLHLSGQFWHRRETVLGRAAMWLNARMPEITHVTVADKDELNDFEEILDGYSGDVIDRLDRRAPDFNGDRETMEYQGIDPDMRGPFPSGTGPMINPM